MQTFYDLISAFRASEMAMPLLGSLLTGTLIGAERQIQGKDAGIRTHTLVCFAATLLTLAAARQAEWEIALVPGTQVVVDLSRMPHGILTGIGFLGAGVIFRQGGSVHGLTTAASLWIASALGIVYGAGMFGLALAGTAATLAVLVLLRVFGLLLPVPDNVKITLNLQGVNVLDDAALAGLLRPFRLTVKSVSYTYNATSGVVQLGIRAKHRGRRSDLDGLAAHLMQDPRIGSFTLQPLTDPSETGST